MKKSKKIGILFMALIILVITPLWGSAMELKDSLGITIDGYPNESIWESAAADFFNMPSGNGAVIRVLADKKYIYVNTYVNDVTVSDSDTFSITVSGIGGSHSIKVNRAGAKLSGSGTYAMDRGSTAYYTAEFRFPANISGPGKVTAKLIVSDNGATASGTATLNLTVPTTAPPTTTKPATTTTTTRAATPTEKPNVPTTKPSSGSNSSEGSATLPPAGGTTAEGATSGGTDIIGTTDNSGAIITTTEGETITTPEATDENTANRWLLIIAMVFGVALVGMLIYVFILHGKRKNDNDHQDESKEE